MKKILFLFLTLFTAVTYGQAEFPEGVQISGGQPTTTTDPYITTTGATGLQGKVPPADIPLDIMPPTIHYTPVTATLKGHYQGIDNALGNIVATTAGNTTRVWFTGDQAAIGAGTFYQSNATGKGTAASAIQSVTNDDNEKKYFATDLIGQPFATLTTFPPGVYAGSLSASTSPNSAQQRFTIELYRCDNSGTPIASGVAGAPVGSLGVTVIIILDSGLLNLSTGSVMNVPLSNSLASSFTINAGERVRYHVSAEKVGTDASNIIESVYYGTAYNSYLDVPVPLNTSGVTNISTVTGATSTEAFDNLQVNKANLSGATFTGPVNVPTPTVSTHAVTKAYTDGLVVGLLDDRGTYNASSNLFPTTGGSGSGGAVLKGDIWYVGTAGTLGGKAVAIGDSFRALVDSPGQTASNWALLSSNLSYVPANDANVVHKTGGETITGVKTFSSSPIVPTPTTELQAVNKDYTDYNDIAVASSVALSLKPVAAFDFTDNSNMVSNIDRIPEIGNTVKKIYDASYNSYYLEQLTSANQWVYNGKTLIAPSSPVGYTINSLPLDNKSHTMVLIYTNEKTDSNYSLSSIYLDSATTGGLLADSTIAHLYGPERDGLPFTDNSVNMMAVTHGVTETVCYNNSSKKVLSASNVGSFSLTDLFRWETGGAQVFASKIPMRAIYFYDRQLTSQEISSIKKSYNIKSNAVWMQAVGNSITAGIGATAANKKWINIVTDNLNIGRINAGESTSKMSDAIAKPASRVNSLYVTGSKNIMTILYGRNDLAAGGSVATLQTNYQNYCTARKTFDSDWKIVVCTILPSSTGFTGGADATSFETNRQAFNTWLRANYTLFADGLADFAADPTIGTQAAASNTTYYGDGVHPTDLTYSIMAGIAQPIVAGFL